MSVDNGWGGPSNYRPAYTPDIERLEKRIVELEKEVNRLKKAKAILEDSVVARF